MEGGRTGAVEGWGGSTGRCLICFPRENAAAMLDPTPSGTTGRIADLSHLRHPGNVIVTISGEYAAIKAYNVSAHLCTDAG